MTLLPSPRSTGYSCETVLFDGTWTCRGRVGGGRFAARIHPSGYSLYQEHDLDLQWRVMDAVGRHGDVPVPRIVGHHTGPAVPWVSPSSSWNGWRASPRPTHRPTACAAGCSTRHPRTSGCCTAGRCRCWPGSTCSMAMRSTGRPPRTHSGDRPAGRGLRSSWPGWPTAGASRCSRTLYAWLRAHMPVSPRLSFTWGDARIGNIRSAPSPRSPCSTGRWRRWIPPKPTWPGGWCSTASTSAVGASPVRPAFRPRPRRSTTRPTPAGRCGTCATTRRGPPCGPVSSSGSTT